MGAAVALVWHRAPAGPAKRGALVLFAIQFLLNMAWSPVFFALQQIGLALAVIVTLWVAIILTIRRFLPLDRTAAFLLTPYLLWVSYATYLNAGFLILNR
jgi:tryptophan-rich sensory protein